MKVTFEEIEDRVRLLAAQRNLGWGNKDVRLLAQEVAEVIEESQRTEQAVLDKVTEYMDWIQRFR